MSLLLNSVGQYRSSLDETARGVLRSRNKQARREEELLESNRHLRRENQRLAYELEQAEERRAETEQRLAQQQRENGALREQPIRLPPDLPLPQHSYGPKMIAVCLNLAKQIGFRPAESALQTIFQWLGIEAKVPSWNAIRLWMMRLGIRMQEKLNWLADFAADLAGWNRCQEVLQACLKFCNEQGLYRGAAGKLKTKLREITQSSSQPCELSSQLATQLVAFVKRSEAGLSQRERAWLSTENLESSFGLFKKLEGQHSKGGFTSLVAAMPTLLLHWTADRVRERLPAISIKRMRQWLKDNLGQTLPSKRALAYQEFTRSAAG